MKIFLPSIASLAILSLAGCGGEKVYGGIVLVEKVTREEAACDGIVRNVYINDVGKLAAWTSASHIEKSSKKTETPTP